MITSYTIFCKKRFYSFLVFIFQSAFSINSTTSDTTTIQQLFQSSLKSSRPHAYTNFKFQHKMSVHRSATDSERFSRFRVLRARTHRDITAWESGARARIATSRWNLASDSATELTVTVLCIKSWNLWLLRPSTSSCKFYLYYVKAVSCAWVKFVSWYCWKIETEFSRSAARTGCRDREICYESLPVCFG